MERAAAAGAGAGAEALDGAARRVSWGEEVKTFFPRVLNKSTFQFGAGLPFCYPFRLVWCWSAFLLPLPSCLARGWLLVCLFVTPSVLFGSRVALNHTSATLKAARGRSNPTPIESTALPSAAGDDVTL
jgi:hypothetical protein